MNQWVALSATEWQILATRLEATGWRRITITEARTQEHGTIMWRPNPTLPEEVQYCLTRQGDGELKKTTLA